MIFFIGVGRFLTNVGIATIWSPRASWGFFRRSINSMRYLSAKCSEQIRLRFAKALTDFGVCPATYSRSIHASFCDLECLITFAVGIFTPSLAFWPVVGGGIGLTVRRHGDSILFDYRRPLFSFEYILLHLLPLSFKLRTQSSDLGFQHLILSL